jgi:phage-related minor tail protein
MATEVGVAYVNIIPKTDGFSASVADAAQDAGSEGGKAVSNGIMGTLESTVGDLFNTGGEMGSALSGGMESFLSGAGKLAIGAAVAAIGVEALIQLEKIGEEIDAMTDEIIVGTGASGESLEEMRQIAMGMSRDVAVSFGTSGDIVQDFSTRLGLAGDDLQEVATHAAKLDHILGGINYDKMATMFNLWGVGADEMTSKMDYMFGVVQSTGIGFDSLTSIMQSSGSTLQMLGFSFEESANLAGMLDKSGIDASSTMNKLSRALTELNEPGESAQETFRRTVDEMQAYIDEGNEAAALEIAEQLFGTRGAAQFIGALQSGAFEMDNLSNSALGATGSINDTYEATESWPEQWQRIQSSIASALEPIATGIFSTIGDILEGFGDALNFIWEKAEPVREVIGNIAAGIGERLGPVIEAISPGLEAFGAFLGDVLAVAFEAIATAVQVVADAISWLWDNVLVPFGEWLQDVFGPIIDGVADLFGNISDFIGGALDVISGNVEVYGQTMVNTMGGDWQAMALQTENNWQYMQDTVDSSTGAMQVDVSNATENIESMLEMEGLPYEVGYTFDRVEDEMTEPIDDAVYDISSSPNTIISSFRGIGSSLSSAFGNVYFPQPHVSWNYLEVLGKSIAIPRVQWYATGGFVDGATLIGAGEAGPEMILPQRGALMDEFADAISDRISGGNNVTVYLQYDAGEDANQIATDIAHVLERKLAMEGAA